MHTFEYDVFLSFASVDETSVRPIWQSLCSSGLRVFWSDSNLKTAAGKGWFKEIERSLVNSQHFLLYCSKTSFQSEWVNEEYQAFYTNCYLPSKQSRRLTLLLAPGFEINQLPTFLKNIQASYNVQELIPILGGIDFDKIRNENNLLKDRLNILVEENQSLDHKSRKLEEEMKRIKMQKPESNNNLGIKLLSAKNIPEIRDVISEIEVHLKANPDDLELLFLKNRADDALSMSRQFPSSNFKYTPLNIDNKLPLDKEDTNSNVNEIVVEMLDKFAPSAANKQQLFSSIHASLKGEEIAAVCNQYFKTEATKDWQRRCLDFLTFAKNTPQIKNYAELVMSVLNHALDMGESPDHQILAINVGQSNFPSKMKFDFFFRAMQISLPGVQLQVVVNYIKDITPSSERHKVAAVAAILLLEYQDHFTRLYCLSLIEAFNYRAAIPQMRDFLFITNDVTQITTAIKILKSWNDIDSASQIFELLDTTTNSQIARCTLDILKQFKYKNLIEKVETMIDISGPEKEKVLKEELMVLKKDPDFVRH